MTSVDDSVSLVTAPDPGFAGVAGFVGFAGVAVVAAFAGEPSHLCE